MTSTCGENDFRHQVVAVGTPLPTSSLPIGAQQGPVIIYTKNLQCMRAMLHLAHCHGCILGTSWHIVLATLQHLVWILGLKPSTGGSLQVVPKLSTDATAGITTSVMADLPVLSQMLSQLFESSQYLDDVALHHLIDALCKLSQEAMELAYSNRVNRKREKHVINPTKTILNRIVCQLHRNRHYLLWPNYWKLDS